MGAMERQFHAQKEGDGGTKRGEVEDGAATVTQTAQLL